MHLLSFFLFFCMICDFLGRIECVEVLVKSGAEIDCKDKKVQPLNFVCIE